MSELNPLTFFGPSSIIEYGRLSQSSPSVPSEEDAKRAFLELLLEKVYLNNFSLTGSASLFETNEEEENLFNNDIANEIINGMFRQQLAGQMIDSDLFGLTNVKAE